MIDLKAVAEVLESTMTSSGILDDADELLRDISDCDGDRAAWEVAVQWNTAFLFINEQLGRNYEPFDDEEVADWLKD